MASPEPINEQGTPTKTAVDMRTDSQWWTYTLASAYRIVPWLAVLPWFSKSGGS